MGRPRKPIQRRKNGIYVVQLHIDGRRVVKSLETRDPVRAAARAQQAIEELQEQARSQQQTKWRADEPALVWDLDAEGNPKPEPRTTTWAEIAEPEEIQQIDWLELVREAETVRRRKTGEGYSASWHRNVGIAIKACPFALDQLSPAAVRGWMRTMQGEGLSPLTINSKCSLLSGLVSTAIRSGLLEGHTNAFDQVDFSTTKMANSISTASEEDYKALAKLLPILQTNQVIPILIGCYCGTRISEVRNRVREDFDLEAKTLTITKAKNASSNRTVPLPDHIVDMLKGFDFKRWGSAAHINSRLKSINPQLTSHSFRHGLTRLSREVGADPIAIEALLGHRLSVSGMANVYGEGYSPEAMRRVVLPVWEKLNSWISPDA